MKDLILLLKLQFKKMNLTNKMIKCYFILNNEKTII